MTVGKSRANSCENVAYLSLIIDEYCVTGSRSAHIVMKSPSFRFIAHSGSESLKCKRNTIPLNVEHEIPRIIKFHN